MSLTLLRFLAMTAGPSITAAARPAATFLAVQLTVAALVAYDLAALPASFEWLVSLPAIVVAAVLAGLETAAKHDPDIAAVLRDLHVDTLTGAFGAFTAALLFVALGMPESEAAALMGQELGEPGAGGEPPVVPEGGVLAATAQAAATDHAPAVQAAAIGGGVALNLGLSWLRAQLLAFVDDFDLGQLYARLETGGVLGVLILLPLLPLIILAVLVFFAAALAAVALTARAAAHWADRRARVPCDHCDYEVREEASLCPNCGTERTPTTAHASGLGAAWRTLRRRTKDGYA